MLIDWIHWLSSLNPDRLLAILLGLLLIDAPRYALSKLVMCLWDFFRDAWRWFRGVVPETEYTYCPSVCVIVAGYNEGQAIENTLESVWGTYPRLEILAVDDGSEDDMEAVVRRFAQDHPGVTVLCRKDRGGKASAVNFALRYTQAEVIVIIDADTHLDEAAIWEIVQPLKDPQVGAVSATLLARNPFTNLVTWLQAYEYLHTIFVGRMLSARLGILAIASGGFSAFRRYAIDEAGGWDVGPGEDGDITMRLRKAGYEIAFAPYAQSYTAVPTTWWGLFKQRRRWNRGVVRYKCRKHLDMAYLNNSNFRLSDFFVLLNVWFFNIFVMYSFWAFFLWLCYYFASNLAGKEVGWTIFAVYLCYLGFQLIQVGTILYYSNARGRDALVCTILPLVPFYQFFQKFVRLVSVTEELFFRRSYEDDYVPRQVREATWRW